MADEKDNQPPDAEDLEALKAIEQNQRELARWEKENPPQKDKK